MQYRSAAGIENSSVSIAPFTVDSRSPETDSASDASLVSSIIISDGESCSVEAPGHQNMFALPVRTFTPDHAEHVPKCGFVLHATLSLGYQTKWEVSCRRILKLLSLTVPVRCMIPRCQACTLITPCIQTVYHSKDL